MEIALFLSELVEEEVWFAETESSENTGLHLFGYEFLNTGPEWQDLGKNYNNDR